MSRSSTSSRRRNKRFHARHVAARATSNGSRGHRHNTMLAPEPWGAIKLPIVFSRAAYERQTDWFFERTGVGTFFGGPVLGWCRCPARDPRPGRRGGAPYWQVELDEATCRAMREAAAQATALLYTRIDHHAQFHPGDPAESFMAQINCDDPAHELRTDALAAPSA